jgi:hypothetical protein
LAALAVTVWIGGAVALNTVTAHHVFHELPRALAAPTMSSIFGAFDSLIVVALCILVAATVTRLWALGWGGRADRIAIAGAVALLVLGALDVGYIHRQIAQLYAADRTLDPQFASLHTVSRHSLHLELIATTLMLGGFAFARRRPA